MAHRILCSLLVVVSAAALLSIPYAHAQPAPADKAKIKQAKAYVDAGLAAQNGNDYDTAIIFYSKAYELVPHPVLLFNIAQAHRLAGHMEQAIKAYQRFLATHPQGAEAQIARDLLDEIAKRKSEQARHVEQATRARKEGRFKEVCVELEAAYALDPKPALLYEIGQAYAKRGKCDEATTFYKRFVGTQQDPQTTKIVDQAIDACKPAPEPAANPPPTSPPPPAIRADKPLATDTRPATSTLPTSDKAALLAPSPQPFAGTSAGSARVGVSSRSPWYEDKLGDALVVGGVAAAGLALAVYHSALSDLDTAVHSTTYQDVVVLEDRAHNKRTISVVLVTAGSAMVAAGILHYVLRSDTIDSPALGIVPARDGGMVAYARRF